MNNKQTFFLPLDLQFFAEETEGETNQQENNTQETNQQESAGDTQSQNEAKTFTQDELNSFLAKQKNDTQNKVLKQLGFENVEKAKESILKLREFEESQKTEQEKQAERLKELETNQSTLSDENSVLKAQISAMKAGVIADYVTDVVTLAKTMVSDDVDMDTAISKIVEKYPHFAQKEESQQQEQSKPKFSQGKHGTQSTTEAEQWLNAFK